MNEFFVLTRVLLKNGAGLQKGGNKKRNVSMIIVLICLLPMIVSTTFIFMQAYDALKAINLQGVILAGILSATCLAMILFGILYVISTYYFSDDTVQLLTMPLRPHIILASKFVIVTIYQYFLEAMILLPCIIAFGIKGGTPAFWIFSAIIFVTLPVIPTVICSVISILLMAFGKFFRNKDRVKLLSGIFAIVIAIGINVVIQMGTRSAGAASLLTNTGVIKQSAMIFPTNFIAVSAMLSTSVLSGLLMLLLFLLISAVCVWLFLLLGNGLYLSGAVGLTQSSVSGKRLSGEQIARYNQRRATVLTLAMKDWRILCRTPAYLLNCVLSAIIFPPLMLVIFAFSAKGLEMAHGGILLISIAVVIVCLFCIMNMASATAVSREGKNIFVSKYIPVSARQQVQAKLLPGLLLSDISLILLCVPALFLFRIDLFDMLAIFVISLVALTAFNMFGLFIDISFPKLDWDDETVAVKRNFNVGIQLIAMIVVLALVSIAANLLHLGLYGGTAFLLMAHLVLLALSAALLFQKGVVLYAGGQADAQENVPSGEKKHRDYRKPVLIATVVILIAFFAVFMIREFTVTTDVKIGAEKVDITAGFTESSSFRLSQIDDVYEKDSIPSASKIVGFGSGSQMRGTFNVEGLGKGHVYAQTGKGPFLYVILKDKSFFIINYSDSSKTEKLYDTFRQYASGK